ncbi:MAG: PAS domain-containing protein [Frankiaceae bacterium]
MSEAVRSGDLALSWGVEGDDTPRLIIPLIRLSEGASTGPVDPAEPGVAAAPDDIADDPVAGWAKLAADSADLVVVLDATGSVLAVSAAAADLFADVGVDQITGRHLLDVLDLVDFNPTPGDASMYADRIPPLLAIASNALSRGLLRVRTGGLTVTLDAVAAPVHDRSGALAGVVAFLARLSA